MNFGGQKGVYILYDQNLSPVYAGQAGLTRKNTADGQSIGDRIYNHRGGIYRNGWELFSWFGFCDTTKLELKKSSEDDRMKPKWTFNANSDTALNLLLASFEAILIEGFAPRFNARGGDLVLMCEIFSGYALAQGVKRLPFPDGTYVTDQAICRMSEGQRIQKFGDAVGSMVRNIEGSKLDNSYELQCETRNVVQTVNKVKF
eukprot:gene53213-71140_t